jgi:C-terminal processing protease CtpA/Prc
MTASPNGKIAMSFVHARRAVLVIGCLSAALLAACSSLPTRSISASHATALAAERHVVPRPSTTDFAPANATPAQRSETLDRVWKAIDDNYYDPTFAGIDLTAIKTRSAVEMKAVHSDADFYRVLKRNVGALHDSHTNVLTPRQAEDARTQQATQLGTADVRGRRAAQASPDTATGR